jgi:DNA-binding NtrC family response regulator
VSAWKVLIVADPENDTITDTLLDWGIGVIHCRSVREARESLEEQQVAQVFCQAKLSDGTYRDVVGIAKSTQAEARVIVLIPKESPEHSFQEAIRAGAVDGIPSPVRRPQVQWEVVQAMRASLQGKVA